MQYPWALGEFAGTVIIEEQANIVKKELEKRNKMFRQEKPFPELTGKTVILVDDGLASGYTMVASIYMVKKMGARKTVVAVPTAPLRSLEEVETGVEEIYCANIRQGPVFAVADAYRHWYDLSQTEVIGLLKRKGNDTLFYGSTGKQKRGL